MTLKASGSSSSTWYCHADDVLRPSVNLIFDLIDSTDQKMRLTEGLKTLSAVTTPYATGRSTRLQYHSANLWKENKMEEISSIVGGKL
jgi:hypothetical protein